MSYYSPDEEIDGEAARGGGGGRWRIGDGIEWNIETKWMSGGQGGVG